MELNDFYNDRKFCAHCNRYVPYLMSLERSYCADCGQEVRLFSESDWKHFHAKIQERKLKGGRPRKGQNKKTA